jgi:drug/metabolite transporter (DMT)-like permease
MKRFLIIFALLFTTIILASPILQEESDPLTADTIVGYLTPFIVLGATYTVKFLKKTIPGWAVAIVVLALSAGVTWATNAVLDPDLSWIAQFGLGIAAIALDQLYTQFQTFGQSKVEIAEARLLKAKSLASK